MGGSLKQISLVAMNNKARDDFHYFRIGHIKAIDGYIEMRFLLFWRQEGMKDFVSGFIHFHGKVFGFLAADALPTANVIDPPFEGSNQFHVQNIGLAM